MKLSMRWLSDYVKLDAPIKEYIARMTMTGSKVEGYEIEGEEIKNVVVAKILEVNKHPNADKLSVCKVDIGREEPIQIVTGATNIFEGAIIPAALDGAELPGGVKIKKGKLRGEESCGMMCSVGELKVTAHDFPGAIEDGILILEDKYVIGQDIREALGLNDTIVEFEITPNRPDCLSVIGLARESAASFGKKFEEHVPAVKKESGDINELLKVEVRNGKLCPRYVARMIKNVKIEPSPMWMRERLRASGVRPINNIVDITNFVMLEYGQPMHAFDSKRVAGGQIIVRNAEEGEKLTTLDGIERNLTSDMLVICDSEKPSAVAGVMGGEYSGIEDDTNTIIFESANFLGSSIRTTSRKLGLRTESSSRFEKGLDAENCMKAVMRACELVEELGAGEVVGGIIDVNNAPFENTKIKLDGAWIRRFLGAEIPDEDIKNMLVAEGFEVSGGEVIVPSWRSDVEHKADIAEEAARFYGYDKIPTTEIKGSSRGLLTERQRFERTIENALLGCGCSEVATYSFISPKNYDKICLSAESVERNSLVITNPLGEDTSIMRRNAIPSMLEVIARNSNNRNLEGRFYELATEYIPGAEGELPEEKTVLVIGAYGGDTDYYSLKGIVEAVFDSAAEKEWEVRACETNPTFHPYRCAEILIGGEAVGVMGEIHPKVMENFGIAPKTYCARIYVDAMYDNRIEAKTYKALPKYPATTRDLALVCDCDVENLTLEKKIKAAAGKILEKVELFDIYTGAQIPEGKKSMAYSLTLRAADRTLTDEEADKAVAKILRSMEEIGVTLR